MQPTERTWGVTPVPDRLRTLSGVDVGLLWGNLGISLFGPITAVYVVGTLSGQLTLAAALTALVVGVVLGALVLGASAVPAARARLDPSRMARGRTRP